MFRPAARVEIITIVGSTKWPGKGAEWDLSED